ncbi:MAG: aminopeptidase N [Pseudolabrys sp.]|nr:aminopeptidase N [Pseudolabrys sp.]
MRTDLAQPVRLSDYRPPDWLVDTVHLDISLHPTRTRVRARLALRPNPRRPAAPLVLDGDGLTFVSLQLNGADPGAEAYVVTPDRLTIPQPPHAPLTLEIETLVDPTANTQLSGLYRSNGTFCTQCEAEGFRRITYFPDRPDVMAVYTTRLEADKKEAPVLLANGNPVARGDLPHGRHFAVWHDPHPKPSYLFALVGGDLACVEDRFRTRSGREVTLRIYVEHGKQDRCGYAMDALKRAMRWDEETFGREYDLDVFMIVAVSDFNMGAMENKGLNIFNDKYVLASPETATDADYAHIEAVIAHEYFHNWTGNRITCRDWFQLCLKEGLTVFRDQEFSADMRSRPVKRIADVRNLRATQFIEDAGPLAHPVRPDVYREINNFYTSTVYEKGAEVVRMVQTLIGKDRFRAGMDLYFARHDGQAATVEEFIQCFAEVSGRDFSRFMRWYRQAGTPEVTASGRYDAARRTYTLTCRQHVPPTPGQPDKQPMVIPLVTGLVGRDGSDVAHDLLVLEDVESVFAFTGIDEAPVVSINRGFSAPIKLVTEQGPDELAFLAAHDGDPFNRWQALQTIATRLLIDNVAALRAGRAPRSDENLLRGLAALLEDRRLEPAFVALALMPPGEGDIAREIGQDIDPAAIHRARAGLRAEIGRRLAPALSALYERLGQGGRYSPDAASAGRRALRNAALDLLAAQGRRADIERARRQYETADNMTDRMAALATLSLHAVPEREEALADFYARYAGDALVIDKWFALQATIPEQATLDKVRALTSHPAFSFANPNRVRALIGTFAQGNATQFNRADGAGYDFVAECVLALDARNPQLAARLATAFRSWRTLENGRRAKARAALERMRAAPALSRDLSDIVERALGGD